MSEVILLRAGVDDVESVVGGTVGYIDGSIDDSTGFGIYEITLFGSGERQTHRASEVFIVGGDRTRLDWLNAQPSRLAAVQRALTSDARLAGARQGAVRAAIDLLRLREEKT